MRRILAITLLILCAAAPATSDSARIVHFTVDTSKDVHDISPYIYGNNFGLPRPCNRIGGNRWTAYNWETNASNAGSDWHHQNDDFLSKSSEPGAPVREAVEAAARNHSALIITVPMAGYVSADKNADGDVNQTPDYLHKRFFPTLPKKPGPLSLTPDLKDGVVYQDEFVNWVEKSARPDPNQVIFYDLDNEPDIWSETHKRIHPQKLTYAEIVQRTTDWASAIKDVRPDALIFGPVNFGWSGYRSLQSAPDADGRDFHQFFLAQMKEAEQKHGRRLLDVLDVHWYPEAQSSDGVRITEKNNSPAVVAARLQAPRSLWDSTYVEKSWITKDSTNGQPIALIPRLRKNIESNYPGTKLAITEYNYGGADHISGAIAEADVLGIFGREGVFCANWWDLGGKHEFVDAAMDLYLNYDGQGSRFGKRSVRATSDDDAATSIYASIGGTGDPDEVVVVLINKSDAPVDARIELQAAGAPSRVRLFQLTAAEAQIRAAGDRALTTPGLLEATLPPMSVTLAHLTAR
jgi:hypothetical protein